MKRAITLLSLLLSAACASNDGFVKNPASACGPGSPIGVEAGWDAPTSMTERMGNDRLTLLVRVSNSSDGDVTVKGVRADPLVDRDTMYEIERGSRDFDTLIAEGDDSTFEIPMMSRRRMQDRTTGVRASGVDVTVTVVLDSEKSVRCQFRLPLGF